MRSLVRAQLRLALAVIVVLGLTLGLLPLLFVTIPSIDGARIVGVPLPWVLLGFVVYPVLVAIGWFYVRRAERNEHDFIDVVDTLS